jgi:signal transduction histidine kinase/ActR/RegA family two-component response regulator
VIVAAAACAAIVYVDRQADRHARSQAAADAAFAAKTSATQLGAHLALLRASVAQLAAQPGLDKVFANPTGCSLSYQGLGGADRGHLDIVRADGTVVCSSRDLAGDAPEPLYAGADWLRRALRAPVFDAPARDRATRANAAVAAVALPGGRGVVAGFSDLAAVGPMLVSLYGGGRAMEFLVTSRDRRTVITRSVDPGRWIGAPLRGTPFAAPAGEQEQRDLDGTPRLYEQFDVPGVGWHFFAGEDKGAALAAANHLRRSQRQIIAGGVLAFLLAAWFAYRRLVAPIRRLSTEVRSRATGSTNEPVPTDGPAEVATLGADVNELIAAVQRELQQREAAEQLTRDAEEQLRQAQRLEAIGQLAGGIAHDFNNLLTVISGYTESLLLDGADQDAAADLRQIAAAAERAALLTRQLLAFSRRQVLEPRVLDPNEIVSSITPMLGRLIGEHIDLVTVADPKVAMVCADAGQLEQVLVNLAVNARDAMPDGGRLTIQTGNVDLDEDYVAEHLGSRLGPHAMIAVTDTGTGIDPETLPHMFEPFFTTKAVGKGTGLGLATVYGIVKQSGGNVWVYSEVGIGTTFKVYLPAAEGRPSGDAAAARPVQAHAVGHERILIAEDDESLRILTTRILEQRGYSVIAAETPEHAIELVERQPEQERIDLLLTDLVLPQMSGRALADRVNERSPTMRVLYMSGYAGEALTENGTLEPGARFLEKPFSGKDLAESVRRTLDA